MTEKEMLHRAFVEGHRKGYDRKQADIDAIITRHMAEISNELNTKALSNTRSRILKAVLAELRELRAEIISSSDTQEKDSSGSAFVSPASSDTHGPQPDVKNNCPSKVEWEVRGGVHVLSRRGGSGKPHSTLPADTHSLHVPTSLKPKGSTSGDTHSPTEQTKPGRAIGRNCLVPEGKGLRPVYAEREVPGTTRGESGQPAPADAHGQDAGSSNAPEAPTPLFHHPGIHDCDVGGVGR